MSQQQVFRLNCILQMVPDREPKSLRIQMSVHMSGMPSLLSLLLCNQPESSSNPWSYYNLVLCYCVDSNKPWLDFFPALTQSQKSICEWLQTRSGSAARRFYPAMGPCPRCCVAVVVNTASWLFRSGHQALCERLCQRRWERPDAPARAQAPAAASPQREAYEACATFKDLCWLTLL